VLLLGRNCAASRVFKKQELAQKAKQNRSFASDRWQKSGWLIIGS